MVRSSFKSWSLALVVGVLLAAPAAHAIPALQIYSPDAEWDAAHETWVITASTFELWVIGDVGGKGSIYNVDLAASFYGTAGTINVTPLNPLDPMPVVDLNPTLNRPGYSGLTNHDEFKLADGHMYWTIGDFTSTADAIQNYQPGGASDTGTGQIMKFTVHVTGYDAVHFDAFDHYYTENGAHQTTHYVFNPPSHDAGTTTEELPEPSTMLLLGTGALGLALSARKKS
jgi:hypothetical protein